MTSLTASKIVRRETATTYRGRPLMIELHPGYVTIRRKGTRQSVTVDYAAAYELGYKIIARAKAQEKAEARKAKRKGSR